ncbi:MAG: sodium:proton antiporter [Clostridia bacterium]|nr:sodium:proton antiporter [Clostridia bacterium]
MENAYRIVFVAVLLALGGMIFFALLRAIKGPRTADRIMGINMIGTLSLLCLAVIALLLKESWLIDVCLIYGMISFLAVAVLAMTQMGQKPGETDDEDMSDGKGGNA